MVTPRREELSCSAYVWVEYALALSGATDVSLLQSCTAQFPRDHAIHVDDAVDTNHLILLNVVQANMTAEELLADIDWGICYLRHFCTSPCLHVSTKFVPRRRSY